MPGALLQLVSSDTNTNTFLNGDPQITFFKTLYRRHTPFATEFIPMQFSTDLDFGLKSSCQIRPVGDLAHRMFFVCTIPSLHATFPRDKMADVKNLLSKTIFTNQSINKIFSSIVPQNMHYNLIDLSLILSTIDDQMKIIEESIKEKSTQISLLKNLAIGSNTFSSELISIIIVPKTMPFYNLIQKINQVSSMNSIKMIDHTIISSIISDLTPKDPLILSSVINILRTLSTTSPLIFHHALKFSAQILIPSQFHIQTSPFDVKFDPPTFTTITDPDFYSNFISKFKNSPLSDFLLNASAKLFSQINNSIHNLIVQYSPTLFSSTSKLFYLNSSPLSNIYSFLVPPPSIPNPTSITNVFNLNIWFFYFFKYLDKINEEAFVDYISTLYPNLSVHSLDFLQSVLLLLKLNIEFYMNEISFELNDLYSTLPPIPSAYNSIINSIKIQTDLLALNIIFHRNHVPTIQEIFSFIYEFIDKIDDLTLNKNLKINLIPISSSEQSIIKSLALSLYKNIFNDFLKIPHNDYYVKYFLHGDGSVPKQQTISTTLHQMEFYFQAEQINQIYQNEFYNKIFSHEQIYPLTKDLFINPVYYSTTNINRFNSNSYLSTPYTNRDFQSISPPIPPPFPLPSTLYGINPDYYDHRQFSLEPNSTVYWVQGGQDQLITYPTFPPPSDINYFRIHPRIIFPFIEEYEEELLKDTNEDILSILSILSNNQFELIGNSHQIGLQILSKIFPSEITDRLKQISPLTYLYPDSNPSEGAEIIALTNLLPPIPRKIFSQFISLFQPTLVLTSKDLSDIINFTFTSFKEIYSNTSNKIFFNSIDPILHSWLYESIEYCIKHNIQHDQLSTLELELNIPIKIKNLPTISDSTFELQSKTINNIVQSLQNEIADLTITQSELSTLINDILDIFYRNSPRCAWVRKLAHFLVEEVSLYLNETLLDSTQSHWFESHMQLFAKEELIKTYEKMIGHQAQLIEFSTKDKPQTELFLPLIFYPNRSVSLSLPLCAGISLIYKINIQLRKFSELAYKDLYSEFVLPLSLQSPYILVEYIYLSKEERKIFSTNLLTYITDEIQTSEYFTTNTNTNTNIEQKHHFHHPVEFFISMMQVIQHVDPSKRKSNNYFPSERQFDNYSLYPYYDLSIINKNKQSYLPILKKKASISIDNINFIIQLLLSEYPLNTNVIDDWIRQNLRSYVLALKKICVNNPSKFSQLKNLNQDKIQTIISWAENFFQTNPTHQDILNLIWIYADNPEIRSIISEVHNENLPSHGSKIKHMIWTRDIPSNILDIIEIKIQEKFNQLLNNDYVDIISYEKNLIPFASVPVLQSGFLRMNNRNIMPENSNSIMWSDVPSYLYFNRTPSTGINVYSWALYPTNSTIKSGSVNMSRIKDFESIYVLHPDISDSNPVNIITMVRSVNMMRYFCGLGAKAWVGVDRE